MIANAISLIQALASVYVLYVGLSVLNRMTRATRTSIFAAYLSLACGAFIGVLTCSAPDPRLALFALAVALFFIFDRRYASER